MHWNKLSIGLGALLAAAAGVSAAWSAVGVSSEALRGAVTVGGMQAHLAALQAIADISLGTRAAGTIGHDRSADYVQQQLAGSPYASYFNVSTQSFEFDYFKDVAPPEFERVSPDGTIYTLGTHFDTMSYSGSGNVTTQLQKTNDIITGGGSTSGYEDSDSGAFGNNWVALIQRGTCSFEEKAQNAFEAGAVAVIIFNEGNSPDRIDNFGGTLGRPFTIPVLSASSAVGFELATLLNSGPVTVRVEATTLFQRRTTVNVIAETKAGRADRVVVAGAHLDSVDEGPGIQDNGSGSAAILEIAQEMAELGIRPRNKVRFIWFSAEEAGLLGSEFYVSQLTARGIKNIAVNLNFDMIASPNFVPFVYDGNGSASAPAGPNGSKVIEDVFVRYLTRFYKAPKPTAFDGRSDYGPFIAVGIPAGGLFTGAEGIKTPSEAALYDGVAGLPYDPCYHLACDTSANVNSFIFDIMGDAAADAILQFAMTTSAVNGTAKGGNKVAADSLLYRGSHLQK